MKLVNCPICGCRCSAENFKCPECDFNIKEYFNASSKKSFSFNKKLFILPVIIVLLMVAFLFSALYLLTRYKSTSTNTNSATSDSTTSSELNNTNSNANIVGVYSGDDHEILVINDDNLAYYYCADKSYTELQCPWYIKDDKIYIEFSRLHCTVSASLNTDELILKAEPMNINWNSEVFTKIYVSPSDYLERQVTPYDINATQNADGTMTLLFDDMSYIIPKEFIDLEDEFDDDTNCSMFINTDAQNDYVGTLVFYCESKSLSANDIDETMAATFTSRFLNGSTAAYYQSIQVNGFDASIFSVSGNLNEDFTLSEGIEFTGFLVAIDNTSNNNVDYIMLVESGNRNKAKGEDLLEIIKSSPLSIK